MESHIAAAVAFEALDSALGEPFRRRDHVGSFGIAAQRDDRLVLEQQKHVADFFFFAQSDKLLLQAQARGVIDGAELDDGDHFILSDRAIV